MPCREGRPYKTRRSRNWNTWNGCYVPMALQALHVMMSHILNLTVCTRQQLKVTDRSCMFYLPYMYTYLTSMKGWGRQVTLWELVLFASPQTHWNGLLYKWTIYLLRTMAWCMRSCAKTASICIWEMRRTLQKRVKEHKSAVRTHDQTNATLDQTSSTSVASSYSS